MFIPGFLAHYDASVKSKIIHRDISSGNILILPTVKQAPGSTELRVEWVGILADWELSKPTTINMIARQDERTVSGGFPSFIA